MGFRIKLAVSGVIAALLLTRIDAAAVVAALGGLAPGPALAAAALFLLTHVVNAAKLRVLMPERPLGTLLAYTLLAQAYALLLPGQVAGEAVKAYRLGRGRGTQGGQAVSSVVFDKLTGIAGVLVLTLLGIAAEPGRFGGSLAWAAAAGLFGLAAAAAALSCGPLVRRLPAALSGRAGARLAPVLGHSFSHFLGHFLDTWRAHAGRPGRLALSLGYGVASQAVAVAGSQMLGRALGIEIGFALWCVVIGALTVVLLAPLTIGGIGLREASLVGLLGVLGVAPEQALALALAVFAFQILVALLGLLVDLTVLRKA